MRPTLRHFWLACCLGAAPLLATTYIPPVDLGELALGSDAVVLGVALETATVERGPLIFTDTAFGVDAALAGRPRPGETIVVQTPGGEISGRAWLVAGSPRFVAGRRYLLCLHEKAPGLWTPRMLSYGLLEEVAGADGSALLAPVAEATPAHALARPDGTICEPVGTYRAPDLLAHLSKVVRGRARWQGAAIEAPAGTLERKAAPEACAFFQSGSAKYRWRTFDTGGIATVYASEEGERSLPSGGFPEVIRALDQWMSITEAGVNLVFGGPRPTGISCSGGQDAEANMIVFNDPCGDIADLDGCAGYLAYGGPLASGTHRFDGATWVTITGWIVVVNNGSGCIGSNAYGLMLAHELGHGLGFDHFEDAGSMMYAYCCHAVNDTDRLCVRYVYPAISAANARPTVDAGSNRSIVLAGTTAYLTGTAADDGLPASPGRVTTTWRFAGGPAVPAIEAAQELTTRVTFPVGGTYRFTLTAHDGELIKTDSVEIGVETQVGRTRTVTFQEGAGGYAGTKDTFIREADPARSQASAAQLKVDGDDPSGSGNQAQALLRFEGLFGAAESQIPPGATILSARLELETTNAGAGAQVFAMGEPWEEDATWGSFGAGGIVPGDEAGTTPVAAVSGIDGTVAIDVTASVAAWSNDPCSNAGWAFLPEGDDGWEFHSSEGTTPPRLVVSCVVEPRDVLVAVGDVWRYFKGTTAPPTGWKGIGFVPDARWLSGGTGIGYGDGDDLTVLADMAGSYLTLYARREFSWDGGIVPARLRLGIDYDDGFVAYLNGVEVARSPSMGAAGTPVTRTTEAESREAGVPETFEIDPAALAAGANILAVEVHNAGVDSSDLSFIPELIATYDLIAGDGTWAFWRGSAGVPGAWREPGFDDSAWERGPAGIGYGDGDDETVLDDMEGSYVAVFCRNTFAVADPGALLGAQLTIVYDDGIVVHLNGRELGRANMPAGAIGPQTAATSSVEAETAAYAIVPEDLLAGENVLAVSVHNVDIGSSDLTFIPVLVPIIGTPGDVDCSPAPQFRRGDATDDGTLDIADAIGLLSFLFGGAAAPPCPDAADANDDGRTDLSDAVRILAYLFGGGTTLPAPGAACGVDPTADGLGACAARSCR